MAETKDTTITALMEQLLAHGPDCMAEVFTSLFNLAMRLERERFLGAEHYERTPERRGYANGYKPKRLDTRAGTVTLDVPNRSRHRGTVLPRRPGAGPAILACDDERPFPDEGVDDLEALPCRQAKHRALHIEHTAEHHHAAASRRPRTEPWPRQRCEPGC